jgi:L-ascorbate metabolism protein UlaG (beta-lactamase superfamily)
MSISVQFFGVAGYKIVTSGGHVLIDPFLDENPYSPVKSDDLGSEGRSQMDMRRSVQRAYV